MIAIHVTDPETMVARCQACFIRPISRHYLHFAINNIAYQGTPWALVRCLRQRLFAAGSVARPIIYERRSIASQLTGVR